jgi:MFS family permease
MMWLVFFLNITAGIMFIGFQSPLLQDLLKKTMDPATLSDPKVIASLAAAGATLIGVSSVFNGIGRFFWGGLSDKLGRARVFRLILGSQLVVFIALMYVNSPIIFGALVSPGYVSEIGWRGWLFVVLVLIAVRPAALAVALAGSRLSRREWVVAAWLAPKASPPCSSRC